VKEPISDRHDEEDKYSSDSNGNELNDINDLLPNRQQSDEDDDVNK